jgi:aryl-alcohol dehydrogenase-like predicted oxidoreductase
LEPWPGSMALPGALKHNVDLMTRVVDHGGLFHDDVKPGHKFGERDHRTFRPAGWVEGGSAKVEKMRSIAEKHGLTMLQLACVWNLSQQPVRSVVPTMIQEMATHKTIEQKIAELASLPDVLLSKEEVELIAEVGQNKGCMDLKGGNPQHTGEPVADRWSISGDLQAVAQRWGIDPEADLLNTHAKPVPV